MTDIYDRKLMNKQADHLEDYLNLTDNLCCFEGNADEIAKAKEIVRKLIKKLRKGEGDKVYDRERYIEEMEAGNLR